MIGFRVNDNTDFEWLVLIHLCDCPHVMIAAQYVHRMYIKRPLYVYNISDILHLMFPIVCMFHQTGRCLTVASKSLASSVCLETFSNHFLPSLVMAHSPSM